MFEYQKATNFGALTKLIVFSFVASIYAHQYTCKLASLMMPEVTLPWPMFELMSFHQLAMSTHTTDQSNTEVKRGLLRVMTGSSRKWGHS